MVVSQKDVSSEERLPRSFNPNDHVMQIKNKNGSADYLPVQWRLVWFRSLCPDGEITTELVHLDLDRETEEEVYAWNNETRRSEKVIKRANGIAVFRAIVKDGKGGVATGTKSEKAASFPDYIEKAECVPLDSQILTRRGFKRHDELIIGEEVLAYDHTKDQCVWTPLRKITCYGSGTLARLYGKWFDVLCTPDHSWAVKHQNGKRELVKAHDLKSHLHLLLSAPEPGGDHPLTPRDAAILGWIVTDGSIRRKGNHVRSYICQSKQENVTVIRELVGARATETVHETPTRTFPSGRTYECLPQHRFYFSATETRRIFNAAGIADTTDLPEMVTRYSHEARQAMLIAMMMADGDRRGNFGKKRKSGVMEAWQILATLEGFSLGQLMMHNGMPQQRLKKRRTASVSELNLEIVGTAPVWCPTTDFGTWVMRQNGRVMITGNTGAIGRALAALGYGTQFAPELNEEHRIVDAPVDRSTSTSHANTGTSANRPPIASISSPAKPVAPTVDDSMATDQQLSSIRKLCLHLGKSEPEHPETLSYLDAKGLITQLSHEFNENKQSRKASAS